MRRISHAAFSLLVLVVALASLSGCPPAPLQARAARVQSRAELIGGPRALGEIGDWLIENDKVRFIIQDEGFSRGFGVFGGALLDADLVRPESGRGDSTGGQGRDNFGEMFPAFFLEALAPTSIPAADDAECKADPGCKDGLLPAIEVEHAGGDGKDAVLLVRAIGDDFLAITQNVNETALGDSRLQPKFHFETRYILHPGAQFLEIDSKITNVSDKQLTFPQSLAGVQVPTPFGDVVLFGAGNKVFTPNQAGYDMRFHLEDIYANGNVALPAFPGLVQEFLASSSKDVSYGLMTFPPGPCDDPTGARCAQNFAFANKAAFDRCPQCGPPATEHSIHVPFIASAFTGAFQAKPPDVMDPGGSFHLRRAFIVGDGDIASISDVVYATLGDKTGDLTGRVTERQRPLFIEGASVFVEDAAGNKVTECASHKDGFFTAKLRPGKYILVTEVAGQHPSAGVDVEITAGKTTFQDVVVDSPAEIVVSVVEDGVGPVPAKATLVGTKDFDPAFDDSHPNRGPAALFDLSVGEPWKYTDLVPDTANDPATRRYVETFASAPDGVIHMRAVPGTYDVVVSRGPEYDRAEIKGVKLEPGAMKSIDATLHRVVDTTGYVSADFHLHSQYSLDSGAKVEDRITQYAAEGLEFAVSTDHNFVVDYQPVIAKLGIEKFVNSMVGIELTTIDRGHFQGYPLERGSGDLVPQANGSEDTIASRTYGSFEWALRTPQQIFDDMRKLGRKGADGKPSKVIVQVNHPRDSILGYFDQYGVSPDDLTPTGVANELLKPDDAFCGPADGPTCHPGRHVEFNPKNFSFDFDAIEVFNGKRYDFLHSFRVPADAPTLEVSDGAGGTRTAIVNPASCCEVAPNSVVLEPSKLACRDGLKDCTCDADTFAFQIESNNCATGGTAFPGVVEDWMNLLLARPDRPMIGTANSDSHDPTTEEPATPRTYVNVGKDEPINVTADDVVAAFHKGDVLMTNGPFVRVQVTGDAAPVGMGGTVKAKDGAVKVAVHVENAPWVIPTTVNVYVNGALAGTKAIADLDKGKHDVELDDVPVATDGFVIVEVTGSESEFPSVYPAEVPPLQFTDVIGALGTSFGFGSSAGALKPTQITVTTPYALTNPVWVDADGDGKITPGLALPNPQASTFQARAQAPSVMKSVQVPWVPTEDEAAEAEWQKVPLRKRIALSRLPRWLWPSDQANDIRRVLLQFIAHAD